MGKSVDDLKIMLEILFNSNIHHYDPEVVPTPFREELYERGKFGKIKIGYCDSLPSLPSTNAVRRGMSIAK